VQANPLNFNLNMRYDDKEIMRGLVTRGNEVMKNSIYMLYRVVFALSFILAAPPLHAVPITQSLIRGAARELTQDESRRMLQYLQDKMLYARRIGDTVLQQQLEDVSGEYYKAHYDQVLQKVRVLGENPEQLLHITTLRDQMLSGNFEQVPVYWLVLEIAAIDWLFAQDAQLTKKRWPETKDKIVYIINLVDDLRKNHDRIIDVSILEDVINDLKTRLEDFRVEALPPTKRQIHTALAKLKALATCRILEKKGKCPEYVEVS
jgi:hypothetical protein